MRAAALALPLLLAALCGLGCMGGAGTSILLRPDVGGPVSLTQGVYGAEGQILVKGDLARDVVTNTSLVEVTVFLEGLELLQGFGFFILAQGIEVHADGVGDLHFADLDTGIVISLKHLRLILEHHRRMTDVVADAEVASD